MRKSSLGAIGAREPHGAPPAWNASVALHSSRSFESISSVACWVVEVSVGWESSSERDEEAVERMGMVVEWVLRRRKEGGGKVSSIRSRSPSRF